MGELVVQLNLYLHIANKKQRMADRPIKVAVLEGDFASLSELGFPLVLSLQLQQSCLRLSDAMWTAKSTNGGWARVKRKRKRRPKASNVVAAETKVNNKVNLELAKPSHVAASTLGIPLTSNNATRASTTSMPTNSGRFPAHYENLSPRKDADSEIARHNNSGLKWQARDLEEHVFLEPCWKLTVPIHLSDKLHTPSDSISEGFDEEECWWWPFTTAHSEKFRTPVAARTHSKLKS